MCLCICDSITLLDVFKQKNKCLLQQTKQYRSVFKINYLLLSFFNPTLPKLSMVMYWCLIFHSRLWTSMVSEIISWTESCIKRHCFQYNFYHVKHRNPSEILSVALETVSSSPGDPMPESLSLAMGLPARPFTNEVLGANWHWLSLVCVQLVTHLTW